MQEWECYVMVKATRRGRGAEIIFNYLFSFPATFFHHERMKEMAIIKHYICTIQDIKSNVILYQISTKILHTLVHICRFFQEVTSICHPALPSFAPSPIMISVGMLPPRRFLTWLQHRTILNHSAFCAMVGSSGKNSAMAWHMLRSPGNVVLVYIMMFLWLWVGRVSVVNLPVN